MKKKNEEKTQWFPNIKRLQLHSLQSFWNASSYSSQIEMGVVLLIKLGFFLFSVLTHQRIGMDPRCVLCVV